ncbi:MAG: alpha/beta hydrolase [Burkholderiaceae bacterium]|nr:MAG: alpha/beta hydrolase [Burkholderiaceae bacterium]
MASKPSASHFVPIRGLRYHARIWGRDGAPQLFMLHGWMDVSASFQFLVDALKQDWQVIAPDWRGYGLSDWTPEGYWIPDYLADLDALLLHYAPTTPVKLIGHSLGGNLVCHYAGIRPERVSHVVSLDAFGLPRSDPDKTPHRLREWLDQINSPPSFAPYENMAAVAARLQKNNPRLSAGKAAFLAQHWAEALPDGSARLRADPAHKLVNPMAYQLEEALACWRAITAPVLVVEAADSFMRGWINEDDVGFAARLSAFRNLRQNKIDDAGHMLHHDQPEQLAALIEDFLMAR